MFMSSSTSSCLDCNNPNRLSLPNLCQCQKDNLSFPAHTWIQCWRFWRELYPYLVACLHHLERSSQWSHFFVSQAGNREREEIVESAPLPVYCTNDLVALRLAQRVQRQILALFRPPAVTLMYLVCGTVPFDRFRCFSRH
jgi:hypothetical protein